MANITEELKKYKQLFEEKDSQDYFSPPEEKEEAVEDHNDEHNTEDSWELAKAAQARDFPEDKTTVVINDLGKLNHESVDALHKLAFVTRKHADDENDIDAKKYDELAEALSHGKYHKAARLYHSLDPEIKKIAYKFLSKLVRNRLFPGNPPGINEQRIITNENLSKAKELLNILVSDELPSEAKSYFRDAIKYYKANKKTKGDKAFAIGYKIYKIDIKKEPFDLENEE